MSTRRRRGSARSQSLPRGGLTSVTSHDLNLLIFRYLVESGFAHTAFTFGYEAGRHKSTRDGNRVPLGALVSFVQKGLLYLELEVNSEEDHIDLDLDKDFELLQPEDLLTNNVLELRDIIRDRKKRIAKEKGKEKEREGERERESQSEDEKEREVREGGKGSERHSVERVNLKEKERRKERERDRDDTGAGESNLAIVIPFSSGGSNEHDGTSEIISAFDPDVTQLEGHTSKVFSCAWSPNGPLLASGSGDSTARIWTIVKGPSEPSPQSSVAKSLVLKHDGGITVASTNEQSKDVKILSLARKPLTLKHFEGMISTNEQGEDVSSLAWNKMGTLLATGSPGGIAWIWSHDGHLKHTLKNHKGPVLSLKWNKRGNYLLSGSADKTAIVWDAKSGNVKQQFEYHSAGVLDVKWRNNLQFASCSSDKMIYVCRLGESRPVKTLCGHQDKVNFIEWDPAGALLASSSDDCTVKIWNWKQERCVHDFKGHTKKVYTIKWSPTGLGTSNRNQKLVLASASLDTTIKLWDVEKGRQLVSLTNHSGSVYKIDFSPNGEFLASGSNDNCLHIWSVKDRTLVKTYRGTESILEVCWNKEGDKVAACFSNTVCVLDLRL